MPNAEAFKNNIKNKNWPDVRHEWEILYEPNNPLDLIDDELDKLHIFVSRKKFDESKKALEAIDQFQKKLGQSDQSIYREKEIDFYRNELKVISTYLLQLKKLIKNSLYLECVEVLDILRESKWIIKNFEHNYAYLKTVSEFSKVDNFIKLDKYVEASTQISNASDKLDNLVNTFSLSTKEEKNLLDFQKTCRERLIDLLKRIVCKSLNSRKNANQYLQQYIQAGELTKQMPASWEEFKKLSELLDVNKELIENADASIEDCKFEDAIEGIENASLNLRQADILFGANEINIFKKYLKTRNILDQTLSEINKNFEELYNKKKFFKAFKCVKKQEKLNLKIVADYSKIYTNNEINIFQSDIERKRSKIPKRHKFFVIVGEIFWWIIMKIIKH